MAKLSPLDQKTLANLPFPTTKRFGLTLVQLVSHDGDGDMYLQNEDMVDMCEAYDEESWEQVKQVKKIWDKYISNLHEVVSWDQE